MFTAHVVPLRLENRHTGEVLELVRRRVNGERVLELRGSLPPEREGPPMHIHPFESEDGIVTAGTLSVELDGRRFTATAGDEVHLPPGVPHRWWNASEEPLAFEGRAAPLVDLDRFLQAIFEIVNAGEAGRPPIFYMAHLLRRHRHTQHVLLVPRLVQRLFFPLVVLLGTLLGKYRGTDWPGCPTRCTGAPEVEEMPAEVASPARRRMATA